MGWVTVFRRANHLSISVSHPGQLSFLPSAGREMSAGDRVVMLCGWGVKAGYGSFHLWINVWVAGKTVIPREVYQPDCFRGYCTNYKALYKCPVYLFTYLPSATTCDSETLVQQNPPVFTDGAG